MGHPLSVPPGFDDLSADAKLEYVQLLWDRIAKGDQSAVPSPEWHREEVRRGLEEHEADPEAGASLAEVRARIETKLRGR